MVGVLRLPTEPNDRCLKKMIAKYKSLGAAVLADRVKQCMVVTVITPRTPVAPCISPLSAVSLAGLVPASHTPTPGCAGATTRGS